MKSLTRYLPFAAFVAILATVLLAVPTSTVGSSGNRGSGGAASLPAGVTPPSAPGSAGVTVGGVTCAPGVRQVPGSRYAPECIPAWHGNNGGATAPGVTASTITVVYREFASSQLAQLYGLIPKAVIGTNDEAVNVLQADIKVFNKNFELYGRHVVLKVFDGKGDLINEMTGTGQPQAKADAVTAQSLGAFADMSLADTSEFYTQALALQHVITFPLVYQQSAATYLSEEPYLYAPGPDCTKSNQAVAATVGHAMAGSPAVYAGDAELQSKTRSFGIMYNDIPDARGCADQLQADLRAVGVTPAQVGSYSFSPATMPEQLTTLVEQMKSSGVTTIILPDEDPVTPGLFMAQAAADDYHPEWIMTSQFSGGNVDADAVMRHFAQEAPSELDHVIEPGIASTPAASQEDYKVFEEGMPGGDPLPTYSLGWTYAPIMILFSALQAAGPNLTATTFQAGFHRITSSLPGGMFGQWQYGPGIADPAASFQLLYWDPNAISNQDGLTGALESCNGGRMYTYAGASTELPKGQAVHCYGR